MDTGSTYTLYIDIPGLTKEYIKLRVKDNSVYVKVLPPYDEEAESCMVIQERLHDETERIIQLSEPVDKNSVVASLSDGVLVVQIQKKSDDDESDLVTIA
jgi:HSP20 family molecular chaperone IbpA